MNEIKTFELNENWFIAKDEHNDGASRGLTERIPEDALPCTIPSIIQQYFPEYHGVAFYFCRFTPTVAKSDTDRLILRFGGADYKAEVWLNGIRLGEYEGGETPFSFDVTDKVNIDKENFLSVRIVNPTEVMVDGLNLMNTPHRNKKIGKNAGSQLNHGGLWYGVSLLSLPAVYIDDEYLSGDIHTGELKIGLDILSAIDADESVCLRVNVCERSHHRASIVYHCSEHTVSGGGTHADVSVTVPDVQLWSPDDPYLYRVEIELESSFGIHRESRNFGFREFHVKDGYFYLNGKRIFLKCAHSGNAFPVGQMLPVHKDQIRKDFILAKSCGFNALRSIAGLFRPEQLDVADEIGLLVYEECYASWCMGYTNEVTDEQYEKVKLQRGYMPLGDRQAMVERYNHSTECMIKRDRNRTCVVIWGLLNETYQSEIFKAAHDFLGRARELDPSRLVILGSGRWDEDYSIGSASNPYSDSWEYLWGADGDPGKEIYEGVRDGEPFTIEKKRAMGDCHYYGRVPYSKADIALFRNMGHSDKPVFLSENGIGPLFHVIEEWKEFMAHGERADLEDSSWLEEQSRSLTRDWENLGLTSVYPFPEMMLTRSRIESADARRDMFSLVRSNPRFCGYSLTGLLDHGWCGEGLWSYWRRMKPEMYDTVSEGWAKLRFCMLFPRHVYSGEEFTFEAVLANEGVLPTKEYTASFAIMSENGPISVFSEKFVADGDSFASPITKRTLKLDLPTGKYSITASLDTAAPAADTVFFYVTNKKDVPVINTEVYVHGLKDEAVKLMETHGVSVKNVADIPDNYNGLVIIGTADEDIMKKSAALAENGAVVLFLNSESLRCNPTFIPMLGVGNKLVCHWHVDWLYHKEAIIRENTIHEGLGHGIVDFARYDQTFPHNIFLTPEYPDEVITPCFYTGSYMFKGAYGLTYASLAYNKGKGKVVFNSFGIEANIGHPAADRLLLNYIVYLTK